MKKHLLLAALLAASAHHATAQYRFWNLVGSNVQGSFIGGNAIVIGTATATAPNNVIIGNGTGHLNTTSNGGNVFIGESAATSNTSGYANVFLGQWSGSSNTIGIANTFVGQWSGPANTTASHNVFVGQGAGRLTNTGGDNSFMGQGAGWDNTAGYHNTFIGKAAGIGNTTGYDNSVLGASAGFYSAALTNATAIGAKAKCGVSNAVILGPDGTGGTTRVNVGIGTAYPTAHLHSVHNGPENVVFSTTSNANYSRLNMNAPGNNAYFFANGNTMTGTHLAAVGAAPAVPDANLAGLITNGAPLTIGVDGGDNNGPIHIINWVTNNIGQPSRAECMRIDNTTGFVGVHTRRTGNGRPQALFHVNLTNPINSTLDPLTQGIRFQGLPAANHPEVIVVDANGNLARRAYGGGGGTETDPLSWHWNGNTAPPNNIFGTLTPQEVRLFTSGVQIGRFTADGNFDFGANTIANSSSSAAVGTNNITNATSVIAAGTGNTIDNSSYSAAIGDGNNVQAGSTGSQATGEDNNLTDVDNSSIVGQRNTIDLSYAVTATGERHTILSSHSVAALGGRDRIENSDESVVAGEDNEMYNGHGCFIGGGHNYSDGAYNFLGGSHNRADGSHNVLLGHHLVGDVASSTPVSPNPSDPNPYVIVMGERINSNLNRSLSVGFNGNRTSVTTERGMAVQLDPASGNTDIPVVNFEAEAGITTTGRMPIGTPRSNIRFHNLPAAPSSLPAVLIDPNTGELFQSTMNYAKPGKGGSEEDLADIREENEALKERVSQLESQLSDYDDKFARLEASLNQICETGCAGLQGIGKGTGADVLYQSIPNPTSNGATISYYLARSYGEAAISLYSTDGKLLHTYTVNPAQGNGSVDISLSDARPGVYVYRLVVDGRAVDVKKLQKQ